MDERTYREFRKIAVKITSGDERSDDLLHDVLEQLETNVKWNELKTKEEKNYFLVRALTNQYKSNNSKFNRTYRRFTFEQMTNQEQVDIEYKEPITLEWVNETLNKELKDKPENWYQVGLFKMYMEHRKIEPIHKKTKIPKYSIRSTIKEMKLWLNKQWEINQNGTN
jgi:hypothetical protein